MELQNDTSSLHHRLTELKCPDSLYRCQDSKCELPSHDKKRDDIVLDVLCTMVETSYMCLPLTGRAGGVGTGTRSGTGPGRNQDRDREIIPAWSTEVEPFRLESKACYSWWMHAGKPRQGILHEAKLRNHALFRHAVRRVRKSEKLEQAQGLFNAAMEGDIKLFKD